jgi:hypothetical protein
MTLPRYFASHNNPSVFTLDNANAGLGSAAIAWLLLTTLPKEATKLASITGTPWLLKTYNEVIPSLSRAIAEALCLLAHSLYLHISCLDH